MITSNLSRVGAPDLRRRPSGDFGASTAGAGAATECPAVGSLWVWMMEMVKLPEVNGIFCRIKYWGLVVC